MFVNRKSLIPKAQLGLITSQLVPYAIRNSRRIAELGLQGLGMIGNAVNTAITSGASTDFGQTSPFTFSSSKERENIQKSREKVRQKGKKVVETAGTYVSPANHVAAWTQGSFNPKVGEQTIGNLDPRLQLLVRGTEIAAPLGGKALKSTKTYKNYKVSRAIDKTTKKVTPQPKTTVQIGDSEIEIKPFEQPQPQTRTKIGDVEINNPQLAYRQGSTQMGENFSNTGIVSTDGVGFRNPMFAQGRLWYGIPTEEMLKQGKGIQFTTSSGRKFSLSKRNEEAPKTDLLVSNAEMSPANQHSTPQQWVTTVNGKTTVQNWGDRRVPTTQATSENTTRYVFEPGYGYRRVAGNSESIPYPFLFKKKQGGTMNLIEFLKKGGSGIHIKPSQRGSFTKYCNGKVTNECIQKGKNSPDPKIRKKATFALNSRKWSHSKGVRKHQYGDTINQSPIVTQRLLWLQSLSDEAKRQQEEKLDEAKKQEEKQNRTSQIISSVGNLIALPTVLQSFQKKNAAPVATA